MNMHITSWVAVITLGFNLVHIHSAQCHFVYQEVVKKLSLRAGQQVLDVGCGLGGAAFLMAQVTLISYSDFLLLGRVY